MNYDYVAVPIAEGPPSAGAERTSNLLQQIKDQGKRGFRFVAVFKLPGLPPPEFMLMEREQEEAATR
jgi:hypothetical protein